MSGQQIRKQAVGKLLIRQPGTRMRVTDRGITWYSDPVGFARAEMFRRPPAFVLPRSQRFMRDVLDRVRAETVIGYAGLTRHTVTIGETPGVLIGTASVVAAVNPDLWAGWSATGLTAKLTARGTVLWYGQVRGKEALYGGFKPLWLGPLAASTEER